MSLSHYTKDNTLNCLYCQSPFRFQWTRPTSSQSHRRSLWRTQSTKSCLPSQPTVEVAVDQADPQSIVITVQQQPDGTCIITLPGDFIGEAIVNITHASNNVVKINRLNGEASARTDDQRAPTAVVAEERSDHNSDEKEVNVDVT